MPVNCQSRPILGLWTHSLSRFWQRTRSQATPLQKNWGNTLIGFLSESIVFCERESDSLMEKSESLKVAFLSRAMKANRSRCSLKKSNWAKRNMSDSLLGINKWKSSEKLSKTYENYEFFGKNRSFLKAIHSNLEWITHVALLQSHLLMVPLLSWATWANRSRSVFCLERRARIAHSRSKIWVILSERVKSERANSQSWWEGFEILRRTC